jgi:hypothetical protein
MTPLGVLASRKVVKIKILISVSTLINSFPLVEMSKFRLNAKLLCLQLYAYLETGSVII